MKALRIFLVLLWASVLGLGHAQTILPIDPTVPMVDLSASTYLLEDPQGTLTIDDVIRPENAQRFLPGSPRVGLTPSAFWMRFDLRIAGNVPTHWWFDTANRRIFAFDLYVPDGIGGYRHQTASAAQPFSARPLPTHDVVFPIELPAAAHATVFLRVLSDDSVNIQVRPSLWRPDAFRRHQTDETAQWFLYCGVAVALLLINLSLYLLIRHVSYLLYSLSVISIVLVVSTARGGYGAAIEYLWPTAPNLHIALGSLTAMMSTILVAGFNAVFTGMPKHLPRTWRFIVWLWVPSTLCNVSFTALTVLHQPGYVPWIQLLVRVWGPLNGIIMVTALVAWIYLAVRGNRSALIAVIASTPLVISGVWTTVMAVRGGSSISAIFLWSSMFELVAMSLALASRFHQEVKAKSAAQQTLVDTLKQSEHELEGKVEQRTRELQAEQARTTTMLHQNQELLNKNQELLHNMLPREIADELAANGTAKPVRHESVSILFSDFSGFTQASSSMPPDRMVAELNDIFGAFDQITHECGVEKIKTIGDAYMAAAGVPTVCSEHAQRCVLAGLRMAEYVAHRNESAAFKWQLRIGVHSGPVVAGVVGTKKFAFDIWGDTVNTASRMESAGEVGKVNISAYTYDLIRNEFDCEYRGKVDAKGKGGMDMYFVKNAKPLSAHDS
jgi:class 3 adenylate cyclase